MINKKVLVYLNHDCYTDTDMTVLKHLAKEYKVIWYYIHESIKDIHKITVEQAQAYADSYDIELRSVDPLVRNRNPKNLLFYIGIAKEINAIKPDIVYHSHRGPYWCLAVRLYLNCKNVVIGIHDAQTHSYQMTLSRMLEKYSKDYSLKVHRHFITFSPNQHDLLLSAYGKESKMVGMSYKDFGKSDKHLSPIDKGVKLLFFGSINEYKGLDLLINTLEQLRTEGVKNITLTIAGRGVSWPSCEAIIKTTEMYNLQVRFVDNSEIPDLMSTHHFLILPYRDATQSGPLATAVAYELPVIAPAFGCFTETYDNDSAILYPQGELYKALLKVSSLSQVEYDTMKKACAKVKEANSEERIAQNYIDCFNELLTKE